MPRTYLQLVVDGAPHLDLAVQAEDRSLAGGIENLPEGNQALELRGVLLISASKRSPELQLLENATELKFLVHRGSQAQHGNGFFVAPLEGTDNTPSRCGIKCIRCQEQY